MGKPRIKVTTHSLIMREAASTGQTKENPWGYWVEVNEKARGTMPFWESVGWYKTRSGAQRRRRFWINRRGYAEDCVRIYDAPPPALQGEG